MKNNGIPISQFYLNNNLNQKLIPFPQSHSVKLPNFQTSFHFSVKKLQKHRIRLQCTFREETENFTCEQGFEHDALRVIQSRKASDESLGWHEMLHKQGFQTKIGGFCKVGRALFHQDGGGVVWKGAGVGIPSSIWHKVQVQKKILKIGLFQGAV